MIFLTKANRASRYQGKPSCALLKCLLNKESYTGSKSFVAVLFLCEVLYFLSGLYHFLTWQSSWFVFELMSKPLYLLYHIGLFSFMYCVTWAVFELNSFKASFLRFLGIIAAIVYVCLPADLIPDFLPIIGQIDDLIAVAFGIYNAIALGQKPKADMTQK